MSPTFTFEISEVPSHKYGLEMKVPTFGMYMQARKKHPNPDESARLEHVPYKVEELLFALCMEKVLQPDGVIDVESIPKDAIDRLGMLDIRDKQFLTACFNDAFMLDTDTAVIAREFASEALANKTATSYTVPKNVLPSGKFSVTISKPTYGTQMHCDTKYQGAEVQGTSMEEFMLASCITAVDSKESAANENDITSIFKEWDILDVQFLSVVFVRLFTINSAERESAKKLGKSKRAAIGTTVSTSSKSKGTTTPASV
jgi:hypothetical protein